MAKKKKVQKESQERDEGYTIILSFLRNKKPTENWVDIENVGRGKIIKKTKTQDGKWAIEAEFETNDIRQFITLMDCRFISTQVH